MRVLHGRIESMGPSVDLTVMASPQHVERLKVANRAIPGPVTVRTLVDTGASCSVLDHGIITRLGLIVTGQTLVHTPSTGTNYERRDQYDASLFLGTLPDQVASFTVSVVGTDLASEGFVAIMGWDVLSRCLLSCHGPRKVFRIRY